MCCVFVSWGLEAAGVKKYIAVGSEAAGSRRLWDGGMFSVHNSPSPHHTCRYTHGYKGTHARKQNQTHALLCETHVLCPGDMSSYRRVASLGVTLAATNITACEQHFPSPGTLISQ